MFIDRESELAGLERMWETNTAEFFVLYGRRRVGKTELLLQFCEDKRHIYFLASQLKENDHLRQFTETAKRVINDPLLQNLTFNDWEVALVYFAQQAQRERFILVLDEFQYLVEANPALPSLLQRFWDLHGRHSQLFLILCGSQVSFMEREVLAERSPLYGRRTGQQQLQPLSYRDSGCFFPDSSPRERLEIYGILGGVPAYLDRFNPDKSLEANIKAELLSVQSYLFDEVNFLLRMELRDPRTYASVLSAVGSGATRLNQIAQRVGLDSNRTNKYLTVLRELGLIRRETPVTERAPEKSRKGLYKIADNYVNFWFRFILPNRSFIESGHVDMVYRQMIVPHFPHYMGTVFEAVCRQYLHDHWDEKLGIAPRQVGAHWEAGLDIDVLTENVDGSHFFGECKWWAKPVGSNVLDHLIQNSQRVGQKWVPNARYLLFSAGDFTDELRQRAERDGALLISADELFFTISNIPS